MEEAQLCRQQEYNQELPMRLTGTKTKETSTSPASRSCLETVGLISA